MVKFRTKKSYIQESHVLTWDCSIHYHRKNPCDGRLRNFPGQVTFVRQTQVTDSATVVWSVWIRMSKNMKKRFTIKKTTILSPYLRPSWLYKAICAFNRLAQNLWRQNKYKTRTIMNVFNSQNASIQSLEMIRLDLGINRWRIKWADSTLWNVVIKYISLMR